MEYEKESVIRCPKPKCVEKTFLGPHLVSVCHRVGDCSTVQFFVVRLISIQFLRSFLSCHFAGKPVVASRNVSCFLFLKQVT